MPEFNCKPNTLFSQHLSQILDMFRESNSISPTYLGPYYEIGFPDENGK